MNKASAEILENAFRRGLRKQAQFELSPENKADMARGWAHGALTSADAFYHHYANFTRDEDAFEANLDRLRTPVTVVWGEEDLYLSKKMGIELARRVKAELRLLPGIGHYPHLQAPDQAIAEIRAAFR